MFQEKMEVERGMPPSRIGQLMKAERVDYAINKAKKKRILTEAEKGTDTVNKESADVGGET